MEGGKKCTDAKTVSVRRDTEAATGLLFANVVDRGESVFGENSPVIVTITSHGHGRLHLKKNM